MKNSAKILKFKDGSTIRSKNGMKSLLVMITPLVTDKPEKVYRENGTWFLRTPKPAIAALNYANGLIDWIGEAAVIEGFDLNTFLVSNDMEALGAATQESITPFYEGQQPAQRYTDAARTQLENLVDEAGNPIYRQVLAVDESAVPSLTKRVKQAARVAATTEAN
jgi:hypothetical protein